MIQLVGGSYEYDASKAESQSARASGRQPVPEPDALSGRCREPEDDLTIGHGDDVALLGLKAPGNEVAACGELEAPEGFRIGAREQGRLDEVSSFVPLDAMDVGSKIVHAIGATAQHDQTR